MTSRRIVLFRNTSAILLPIKSSGLGKKTSGLCTKDEKYGYLECEKTAKSKGEKFMTSPSKSQIKELLDRLQDLRGHL